MSARIRAKRTDLQKNNLSRTPIPDQAPARAGGGKTISYQGLVDVLTLKGAKALHTKGKKKTRPGSWISDAIRIDQLGR